MRQKPGPPEPPTFFLDRCLGRTQVAAGLVRCGAKVELHDDHFTADTPDTEWIAEVGRRGWAVLTKDKQIRRHPFELSALLAGGVAAFILTAGDVNGESMAEAFVSALPKMTGILAKYRRPLIATVSASGAVTVKDGVRRGGPKPD